MLPQGCKVELILRSCGIACLRNRYYYYIIQGYDTLKVSALHGKKQRGNLMGDRLFLHIPSFEELDYRKKLLSQPDTMSYNIGYELGTENYNNDTGCIDFNKTYWESWYSKWINNMPQYYYAYLTEAKTNSFIGEVCFHYEKESNSYCIGIIVEAKFRGRGYCSEGLSELAEKAFMDFNIDKLRNFIPLNRVAAIKGHKRAGFKEVGIEEGNCVLELRAKDYLKYGGNSMGNTALVIVDVQNALVEEKPFNIDKTLFNIKELLNACRENGIEVIYVQHDEEEGEELKPFSQGWHIHSSIYPNKGEKIIRKTYNSAFKNTELESYLARAGIETLILVGMQTEYCIDTTVRVAFEKGFRLIMPEQTNTTFDNGDLSGSKIYEYHNFRIFKDRFAEVISLNEALERINSGRWK